MIGRATQQLTRRLGNPRRIRDRVRLEHGARRYGDASRTKARYTQPPHALVKLEGKLGAHPAYNLPFLNEEGVTGVAHRSLERAPVDRPERAQVDDLSLDAFAGEQSRRLERHHAHVRMSDQRNVAALAPHGGAASRN